MLYGYARVSTQQQSIERQIRNIIREYPTIKERNIFQESYTGTTLERKQFQKLLNKVKEGDVIIFDSVSRMSRTADDGYNLYMDLYNKGVELVFIKEHYIDTRIFKNSISNKIELQGTKEDILFRAINEYMVEIVKEQIKVAFEQSEKEVMDLRQRTKEGLETARLNGKVLGHPKDRKNKVNPRMIKAKELILKHYKKFGGNFSATEVANLAKISRNSFYRLLSEIEQEQLLKEKELGIMKGQVDVDDLVVEAELEPIVKVTNSTAPISAVEDSTNTNEPTVVVDMLCNSSIEEKVKVTKKKTKSPKNKLKDKEKATSNMP